MSHKKRRVIQSIMEEESLAIVRKKLPKEWVIHQYAPDYGIDFVVETFDFIDDSKTIAETLGEFFFVQLKSVNKVDKSQLVVHSRINIEKSLTAFDNEKIEIDVIKYPLDVDELYTVLGMGVAVPTVLFLVDLSTENTYFLCLNDYLEKVIMAEKEKLNNTSTITIYIPVNNNIDSPRCCSHLSFLARRSKLFGAFNKFNYQRHELNYDESPEIILHFVTVIKQYDFWQVKVIWPALEGMFEELLRIEEFLNFNVDEKRKFYQEYYPKLCSDWFEEDSKDIEKQYDEFFIRMLVLPYWDKLCNLGRIYEEICKEWFLPTFFWHECY